MDNIQTLTASGLVGQTVNVEADKIEVGNDSVVGQLQLAHAAGTAEIVLTDSRGISKTIALGTHEAGTVPFELSPSALELTPGTYSIQAKTDAGEKPVVEISGEVLRVRVSEDGPVLDIHGAGSVPFYKLTEFGQTA